jgi:hypothetical protein
MIDDGTRVIRYQYRQTGLVHLTTVQDYHWSDDGNCGAIQHHETFCGKYIPIGTGGWGHGTKKCEGCWSVGAPAEKLRW